VHDLIYKNQLPVYTDILNTMDFDGVRQILVPVTKWDIFEFIQGEYMREGKSARVKKLLYLEVLKHHHISNLI
jgi:hypothetical protein